MTDTIDRSGCTAMRHGTADAYRYARCRCPDATRANTLCVNRYRAGLTQPVWMDPTGVIRRRQALAVMGYGLRDLAPLIGLSYRGTLAHTQHARVHRDTVARWREVYDRLSMIPGPNVRARRMALRKGWVPPLAWDDDTIDDSNAQPQLGERRARGRTDIAEEARHLLGFGMSMPAVAKQLEVSEQYLRLLLGGGKRAAA